MYCEGVCAKPPRATPMNELESLRATCKTLPQQYQAYLSLMGEAHKTILFEDFVDSVLVYRPNSAYLNSLRKNKQSRRLEEHERSKNHPTYEKSSEVSFSIDEEITDKFMDHMVRAWKKFHPK